MDKIRQDKAIKIWKREEDEEEGFDEKIWKAEGTASNTLSPTWLIQKTYQMVMNSFSISVNKYKID